MPQHDNKNNHPALRRHKRKGRDDQAFVLLNGQRHYLGRWGSDEAQQAYDRLIAEWLSNGRRLPLDPEDLTVVELGAAYWSHIGGRHVKNLRDVQIAIKMLDRLYGDLPAAEFGPRKLKALRQTMIDAELSKSSVTKRVQWIKRCFRWGVAEELVPASVYHALQSLEPLRESDVKKPRRVVHPLPQGHIRKCWPHMTRPVRGLVLLLRLTAARPSELVGLRAVDIDTSGDVWKFKPEQHKTSGKGRLRTIYFGSKAQKVLRAFMLSGRDVQLPLFSPREAFAEVMRRRGDGPGRRPNQKPNERSTDRTIRDQYDSDTLRRAIEYACKHAGIKVWTPYQLRHTAATMIRAKEGLEAAQVILGHAFADVTQIYAQRDEKKAIEVIRKLG